MIKVKCSSELVNEFIKQLAKRFIWFKETESVKVITSDFALIEIDGRNGFAVSNYLDSQVDLTITEKEKIFYSLEQIYKKEIYPVGVVIILNMFALTQPKLTITFDKVTLTYGSLLENIPLEVFDTISSMYTYTWCSNSVKLVSVSKHIFEIDNKQVGSLLIQDIVFIRDLITALNQEFMQFLKSENKYPDYSKFDEAVTKYLSPYMTGVFQSYLKYQKSTFSKIFINTLHQLDELKNSYSPEKSNAIKIPPTGISEQK